MHRLYQFLLGIAMLMPVVVKADQNPLWMRYPAISPDGQFIVFSYQGDLYRVAAAGGQAIPLTLSEGHDFMPVWSRDGKQIAFASDRYGNYDVFVMPSTGGAATRLTYHSANDLPSDFTPDGKHIIFSSSRTDAASNVQFPYGILTELYKVSVAGGRAQMLLTTPAEQARYNRSGNRLVYHDNKGYEDPWRKHHTSSISRDVWVYDVPTGKHTQLTTFNGEDRNPVLSPDEKDIYFLCESSGSFNVHKMSVDKPGQATQVTKFSKHPVRFLTMAESGTLCYGYDGEIYTQTTGSEPKKVVIQILNDTRNVLEKVVPINSGATEMALSPNGKEIAFVFRGEVYVTSVEGGVTKRVTNTSEQERSVSFSPDGRTLLYAGERNNNWNIYKSSIIRKEEPYFYSSTVLKEEPVAATTAEEFQPSFSPDGKEVAYLEERVTLKVINLESKATRVILSADKNYSYSDGDQYYTWSPDGKFFLATYSPSNMFSAEVALIPADGKGKLVNLTESGYSDESPKWMMNGKMMIWFSDRDGMKNHGSWGGESDVYGMFFTKESWDRYKLSKEDFTLLKEKEEKEQKEAAKASEAEKKDDKKKAGESAKKEDKTVKIEFEGLDGRKSRLTIHSSNLTDAAVSPNGDRLFYMCRFEKGYDLWVTDLRSRETKILAKLEGGPGSIDMTKDGKSIFVSSDGKIMKIDAESGKREPITINGEMNLNTAAERAYIFDHAWRQVLKKFYVTNLHGVDWDFYHTAYAKFLPHINNNRDFAEMLSEMLGELNASHTGCRYAHPQVNLDATASLGLFYDQEYDGKGLRVVEVMGNGPLANAQSKVEAGTIIEKIDGEEITTEMDYNKLLNRKANKNVLLSCYNEKTKVRWEETVKPITLPQESELRYQRWVTTRRKEVDKMSNGSVGYVHIRGMNDASYRTVVEEVLGKCADKESLIVDTRFNGGGWLHDDLATFLSGKKYLDIVPRGVHMGHEPFRKWIKPSVVLVGEGNYSDAHMFPFAFRENNIGKIIGMPVPGTGTAVWWETQIDPTLVFGIPQVGMVALDGKYLENNQLEPDVKVMNQPEVVSKGRDQQLEKAVDELKKSAPAKVQSKVIGGN
ncbi:S41 family peptidase [Cytophagaceae bacterium YF14B1]|uniref:Tricorn protease homolog n=1 Tax=Xanthocytophaga flava TaxID=3048013 RepID=A0AAE3QTD3_9BACT|nr:S41 family peptidase [Xanthocytophaga flavus]MDJ1482891.1 S41 family peptidase [Xanthocytophaga flavus]